MNDAELILAFFKGRDGRIIARTSEGKVCLLDIPYCRENRIFVRENEEWRCVVVADKKNVNIVQPITKTLTAEENEKLFEQKAKQFQKEEFAQKTVNNVHKKRVGQGDNL